MLKFLVLYTCITDPFPLVLPESIGTASSTSSFTLPTSSTSTSFSTTSLTASSTSPTSGQSGSSSGSNAGTIAGGIIGGVFGLALIGGIVFCFLRRRHQGSEQQPPSSAFNTTPYIAAPHSPDQKMNYNPPVNPVTPAQKSPYVGFFLLTIFPTRSDFTPLGSHILSFSDFRHPGWTTLPSDANVWIRSSGSLFRHA